MTEASTVRIVIPRTAAAVLLLSLLWGGVSFGAPAGASSAREGPAGEAPGFCLALRGNGYKVPVTLAAMARLTEEVGVPDVLLGTSSGSIAAFLYENMLSNPALRACGGVPCSGDELARRVSLAIKSLLGFTDYLKTVRSGRIVEAVSTRITRGGKPGVIDVLAVVGDPQLLGMINGRALAPSAAVLNPFNWSTHIGRLRAAAGAANFGGQLDFELFLREGLLDLEHVVWLIGRVGDFYSNTGPDLSGRWTPFFHQCAHDQIDTGWPSIASRRMSSGRTCGEHFLDIVLTFNRKAYPPVRQISHHGGRRRSAMVRVIEPQSLERTVGQGYPVLATVSFVKGQDIYEQFKETKARYDRFRSVDESPRDWSAAFRVAYFGPQPLLETLGENRRGFTDLKTRRFYAAGQETWGEVMLRSIGEPGLQVAKPYRSPRGDHGVTAGGWVDNFGTPPLKNLGCENVAFITRRGSDANFAAGVAHQLGGDDAFIEDLFGFTGSGSAGFALGQADAIVCTDWDSFRGPLNSPLEMASHGYESPVVSRDPWLLDRVSPSLPVETEYLHEGCRPPEDGSTVDSAPWARQSEKQVNADGG